MSEFFVQVFRASACYVGQEGGSLCIVCTKNSQEHQGKSCFDQIWSI